MDGAGFKKMLASGIVFVGLFLWIGLCSDEDLWGLYYGICIFIDFVALIFIIFMRSMLID